MKFRNFSLLSITVFASVNVVTDSSILAQVTIDGTTFTTVTPTDTGVQIDNGSRAGDNLFHSFDEFSVPTSREAFFNNTNDITNIFSRVTGGNTSNIDGILRANGTANLFLINPAGILFGENASLNLGGSFFASTADSLLFEGNTEFSATNPTAPPLLKVNMPIGLNLGDNPGEIVNRSIAQNSAGDFVGLEVAPGENLTLVGGNINFEAGEATASGGNIQLAGLSAAGTVGINEDGSLNFPEDVARADITLSNATDVDVRGTNGGSITINARNLNLQAGDFGASFISAGITADSTSANARAGDITIDATDNITVSQESTIANSVEEFGVGNAGGIKIHTANLFVKGGSLVDSSTNGRGNAGAIIIEASENISLEGVNPEGFSGGINSRVGSTGEGNAGEINLTTTNLFVRGGSLVESATLGQGNAGAIIIEASETISLDGENIEDFATGIFSDVFAETEEDIGNVKGNGGNIEITTGSLLVTGFAQVSSSNSGGEGDAGSITITAKNTVSLDGQNEAEFFTGIFSDIFAETEEDIGNVKGNGGNIEITTGSLLVTGFARVSSRNDGGEGNAGNITITAKDTVTITGFPGNFDRELGASAIVFSDVAFGGIGNGGNINITAGSVVIKDEAIVAASIIDGRGKNGTPAQAGNVNIKTTGDEGEVFLSNSTIFSEVGSPSVGNGGTINIETAKVSLENGASLRTNVRKEGKGNGGNINLTTDSLKVRDGSQIFASTSGEGDAGKITIVASDRIFLDGEGSNFFGLSINENRESPSAVLSTAESTAVGEGGSIEITTSNFSLTNNAEISVRSLSEQGTAGVIFIQANSLALESRASLLASTLVGTGGNITLQITDNLTLQNNSTISAQALENADGGNANIEAEFIIAFPNQNNDIIARAEQGNGGNIDIFTKTIFGIEERSSTPANRTNDLDASSEFGLDGTVEINQLDVNPAQELQELPSEAIDVTKLVAQNLCQQDEGSEFILTGKGGLAPSPSQTRSSNLSEVNLVEPALFVKSEQKQEISQAKKENNPVNAIAEARGWIVNQQGNLELVAYTTDINNSPTLSKSEQICPQ